MQHATECSANLIYTTPVSFSSSPIIPSQANVYRCNSSSSSFVANRTEDFNLLSFQDANIGFDQSYSALSSEETMHNPTITSHQVSRNSCPLDYNCYSHYVQGDFPDNGFNVHEQIKNQDTTLFGDETLSPNPSNPSISSYFVNDQTMTTLNLGQVASNNIGTNLQDNILQTRSFPLQNTFYNNISNSRQGSITSSYNELMMTSNQQTSYGSINSINNSGQRPTSPSRCRINLSKKYYQLSSYGSIDIKTKQIPIASRNSINQPKRSTLTSKNKQQYGSINMSATRPHKCAVPGCSKAYKNVNGLAYHIEHGHRLKCPVPGCPKESKNTNGLKYHIEHEHRSLKCLDLFISFISINYG